ncbi:hypothetical protein [Massilia sp. DD77]|uniref:hypothetical protein n=1 Tax=Massilia sp. DD77 TaxID=3109349 RepID=UPI00300077C1
MFDNFEEFPSNSTLTPFFWSARYLGGGEFEAADPGRNGDIDPGGQRACQARKNKSAQAQRTNGVGVEFFGNFRQFPNNSTPTLIAEKLFPQQ